MVYLIIAGAIFYTGFSVIKSLRKKSKNSICDGCDGCSMRKEITQNLKSLGKSSCEQHHHH